VGPLAALDEFAHHRESGGLGQPLELAERVARIALGLGRQDADEDRLLRLEGEAVAGRDLHAAMIRPGTGPPV
jgi:hypothetical protein